MNTYLVICLVWQCAVFVNGYLPDVEHQRIQPHNIQSVAASSMWPEHYRWNAVDGVKKTDNRKHRCFHSAAGDNNPWWSVTYKVPFQIEGLVITNRQDCCSERLSKLTVTVDNQLCATHNPSRDSDPGPLLMLKCAQVLKGSTIKIARKGPNLTLCEVEPMQPK